MSFVQHFLSFPGPAGTHEINFMFRKINISKKKQFYQEIPIENMRYLNKKRKSQLSSKVLYLKQKLHFMLEKDILKINTIGIWVRD